MQKMHLKRMRARSRNVTVGLLKSGSKGEVGSRVTKVTIAPNE